MTENSNTNGDSLIKEQKTTNIYVLPFWEDLQEKDLKILILPDGNTRAGLENKSYDDGGQNIIGHAEFLAEQGDVSIMVACILGPDNLKKRTPEFKRKIIMAFEMLCERMEKKGTLINSDIRLETYGDLEAMAKMSHVDAELADVIRKACQKTAHIKNPALRLILGVNYDDDIALNLGINMIDRTGMETANNFRTSGIRVHPGIMNCGSVTLWPDVETEETDSAIKNFRKKYQKHFQTGYSLEQITSLVEAIHQKPGVHTPDTVTIPYRAHPSQMKAILKTSFQIELYDTDGKIKTGLGQEKKESTVIKLVHGGHLFEYRTQNPSEETQTYTAFIAPGQNIGGLTLPSEPELGYANVHACPNDPREIAKSIKEAVEFTLNVTQPKGAERTAKLEELPEFSRYYKLKQILNGHAQKPLEEVAKIITGQEGKTLSGIEHYNFMADLFVAKMIAWCEEAGIQWPSARAFRAAVNYAFTSFFFAYFPNHPDWKNGLEKGWEKKAELLARYMILTYAMDDFIYDLPLPESERAKHINDSTAALVQSIKNPESPVQPQKNKTLEMLCDEFKKLANELRELASAETFANWQKSMTDIMECMRNEWQDSVLNNRLTPKIKDDPGALEMFRDKYLNAEVPVPIRKLIETALESYLGEDEEKKQASFHDLKLFAYLVDIEKSIGSGNIYKTLACINSKEQNIDPEVMKELDRICSLINHYFRIANDLAEYSRSPEDRDEKVSAVQILEEKYRNSGNAEKAGFQHLMGLMLQLRGDLYASIENFQKKHHDNGIVGGIGIALQRARIGELFYQGTHYREAKRDLVKKFFLKLQDCGINIS